MTDKQTKTVEALVPSDAVPLARELHRKLMECGLAMAKLNELGLQVKFSFGAVNGRQQLTDFALLAPVKVDD